MLPLCMCVTTGFFDLHSASYVPIGFNFSKANAEIGDEHGQLDHSSDLFQGSKFQREGRNARLSHFNLLARTAPCSMTC
jgi:hypothetical protein